MLDAFLDALLDCAKMLPILYLAYLLMEFFEHRAGEKTGRLISRVGRAGPVAGALLGIVPQCGFSGAVAGLYAGGVVTLGTVFAVFIATSDEMLPILLSANVGASLILKILLVKFVGGVAFGFAVDLCYRKKKCNHEHHEIHELCERENCSCNHQNIFIASLIHSVKVIIMIFAVTLVLNLSFRLGGEDILASFALNKPVIGELTAGVIGLVPGCSSSVLLTNLYIEGAISVGAMISGLMVNAGVGLIVLFRLNKNLRENIVITAVLYALGVVGGIAAGIVL